MGVRFPNQPQRLDLVEIQQQQAAQRNAPQEQPQAANRAQARQQVQQTDEDMAAQETQATLQQPTPLQQAAESAGAQTPGSVIDLLA